MANSIQEIKNVVQALKDLSTQAEAAKTPLRILSGTIEAAVGSGDVDKINTATKAIQNFYSSVEAGKTKSAVNLRNLIDTQGLLADLERAKTELNTLATNTALKQIGVTPTQASKTVAASQAEFTDFGTGKKFNLNQSEVAEFAGIKPSQVRKVLSTVSDLIESGINVALPELSKTAKSQLTRTGSNKLEEIVTKRQERIEAVRDQQIEAARLQAEQDAKAFEQEQSKLRDAVWKGPTEKQPFAPNSVVRQARRDFESEMEARAQPFVQSNPAFQITPADEAKGIRQAAAESEKLQQIEQQQQKLLENHIASRQKETEALRKLGEETITAYEKQGSKFATRRSDAELADQERLKKLGESTMDDYDRQGAKFANQQAEAELKTQEKITKEREKQAQINREQAKVLQDEIDKRIHDPRQSVGTQTAQMGAEMGNDPVYQAELQKQRQEQVAQMNRQLKQQAEAFRMQQSQQNLQDNPLGALGQVFGGNVQQINALRDRLKALNLDTGNVANGFGNLKRVSTEASTGVSALSFSMTDASGITREASMHVDRFGRILQDTSGRFQNFGDLISRNVVKVLEWAVSLTLVYGSIQKISELAAMMKNLQQEMVDINIVTGQSTEALRGMFDEVKKISDVTASDFGTGIKILNTSLRATSNIEDPSKRTDTALKLLNDAMTLSKLSGPNVDNATAMDQLIASLKQMNMELTQGSELLDKFQSVSQASNTSMEDMSATFAITAGAAQDVGVKVDELTGLIGAFSEATTLSSTETGNALRAMFSNFTQPQGIETLNKYGIAVKNVDGTFRSFMDVFRQASELSRSGLLNDRQVADLANALGGGSRRQAQVTALLTVEPRAEELANVSKYQSQGKAQAALKQETQTLQSANERLQNSFDNLARTLGDQGGFLGHLTKAVDLLSGLLDIVSKITDALGPSTSTLIGYGLAMAALTKYKPELIAMFGGINGQGISGALKGLTGNLNIPRTIDNGPGIQPTQLTSGQVWLQAGKNFAGAAVPVLLSAFSQLQSGNTPAALGTAIGGGLVAALSGNPLWALIGSVIGQAAADLIDQAGKRWAAYNKASGAPLPSLDGKSHDEVSKIMEEARTNFIGLASATPLQVMQNEDFGRGMLRFGSGILNTVGLGGTQSENLMKAVQHLRETGNTLGNTYGFSDKDIQNADKWLKIIEQGEKILKTPVKDGLISTTDPNYKGLMSIKSLTQQSDIDYDRKQRFSLIDRLGKGDITKSDYKDALVALPNSTQSASQALIALHPQLRTADENGIKPFLKDFKELKDLFANAPLEDRNFLSETVSNISQTRDKIENLKNAITVLKAAAGTNLFDPTMLEKDNQELNTQNALLAEQVAQFDAIRQSVEAAAAAKFKFKGFSDYSDMPKNEFEKVWQEGLKLQSRAEQQLGYERGQIAGTAEEMILQLEGKSYERRNGLRQEFLQAAIDMEKTAKKQMEDAWNFQAMRNVEISQKGRLQQAINYYTNLLKQWGFNEKNELITVLFKDNQVGQLIGSQTALQLAMQDLTEVEKKQLDGIYNLPSGATAYIPLSAGQMLSNYTSNQAMGSNRDYGNFPTPVLEQGNQYAARTAQGVERLVTLYGQEFDPKKQVETMKQGLQSGEYKNFVDALNKTSIFNTQMGPPAPSDKTYDMEDKRLKLRPEPPTSGDSLITNLASQLSKLTNQLMGMSKSSMLDDTTINRRPPGLASPEIKITPGKIESTYNTTTTIRLDGRVIWSAIKKYAFEDYARYSSSIGNNGRSRTNVI